MAVASENPLLNLLVEDLSDRVAKRVLEKIKLDQSSPLVFSIPEAAKKLGPSVSTLKNMIRDRELAVVRRGTRVLLTRAAIETWVRSNET